MADRARGVAQRDEDIVLGGQPPASLHLGVDVGDSAEQRQRLVHEMATEVQQQPASLGGGQVLAPRARLGRRPPALEARFVADHISQVAAGEQAHEREMVGVPAAVLEHREQDAGAVGAVHELLGPGGGHRERLVHHHGQAVVDRRGRQRKVGVVGGGDDHEVVVVALPQPVGTAQRPRPGVVASHLRLALAAGGHDARDRQPPGRRDQLRMEDAPGESVSDDRHAQIGHPPSIGSGAH